MKRLALLTAAGLLASAPVFAMDGGGVSISGEANFGVKFAEIDDDSKSELQFHHEFDVKFSASGTTDGGIGFGGSMSIDNTESVSGNKATAAKTGYIVTEDDVKDAKARDALAARFGIDTSTLEEGDVIESGAGATSLSGYKKATVAGHNRTASTPGTVRNLDVGTQGGPEDAGALNAILFSEGSIDPLGSTNHIHLVSEVVVNIRNADNDGNELTTIEDVVSVAIRSSNDEIETNDVIVITTSDGVSTEYAYGNTAAGNISEFVSLTGAATTSPVTLGDGEKAKISQAYIDSLSASVAASDKQKVDNHGEVYISMDMHKLTIGSDLDAADKLAGGIADPGFDGIGIDDVAEGPYGGSAADVRYDGDFGVAKVAISYGDNAGDAAWAAGFSFNVEPVNFGAGFDSNGVMSVGMGFTQGAIAMNALYSTDSDHDEADNEAFKCSDVNDKTKASYNAAQAGACTIGAANNEEFDGLSNKPDLKNQAFGVDVSYQMNETTSVVLVAAQHKKESAHVSHTMYRPTSGEGDNKVEVRKPDYTWSTSSTTVDAFGVGFSHDLGGGATLKAGAGSVDSNAVADLGITMKF